MKTTFIIFILLIFCFERAVGQNFYEIKWKGQDNTQYEAFLVYYSDEDAYLRVRYTDKVNKYKVAEYKLKGKRYVDDNGTKYHYLDGYDAKVIYNIDSVGYTADNFLFAKINANDQNSKLLVIDDTDLKKKDYQNYFSEGKISKIDPNDFTEKYLYNYFEKNERKYSEYISLKYEKSKNINKVSNTKLHLIIVANTLDPSIGASCDIDRKKLVNELSNISSALNIEFNYTMLYNTDFQRENVVLAINNLQVQPNDIIIFFYRGHGFRWSQQTDPYPQMSMRYSAYQPLTGLSLSEVYNTILTKGARLNLVFGDMCNNDIGISQPINQPLNILQSASYPDLDKLNRLFLQAKGNLISAAAKPGEVSWSNNFEGGLFTSSFFDALYKEVSADGGTGDWSSLTSNMIAYARYKSVNRCSNCTTQNGIKYIDIKY